MKIGNIRLTKSTKFLILLLTSLLVAAANAAIFYSLTMQPSVKISEAAVRFVQGTDWPGGSWGVNGTWCVISLKGYPNATLTYQEPLNLSETSGSNKQFRLVHQSITPASGWSAANWTFINFTIMNESGNPVTGGSFDYYTTGSGADAQWHTPTMSSDITVPADTMYTIKIETKAAEGALLDQVVNIMINVDVTE